MPFFLHTSYNSTLFASYSCSALRHFTCFTYRRFLSLVLRPIIKTASAKLAFILEPCRSLRLIGRPASVLRVCSRTSIVKLRSFFNLLRRSINGLAFFAPSVSANDRAVILSITTTSAPASCMASSRLLIK